MRSTAGAQVTRLRPRMRARFGFQAALYFAYLYFVSSQRHSRCLRRSIRQRSSFMRFRGGSPRDAAENKTGTRSGKARGTIWRSRGQLLNNATEQVDGTVAGRLANSMKPKGIRRGLMHCRRVLRSCCGTILQRRLNYNMLRSLSDPLIELRGRCR